ncbi:UNVERIFIED_CONTAM: Retrovirus-related Pol polyprotein from transposon gypsy [Sesamum indicum]
MKFPTKHGVREVKCDQRAARQCYNLAIKQREAVKKEKRKEDMSQSEEVKRGKMERLEQLEEYKEVELITGDFQKTARIGSQMSKEMEMLMIHFLRNNSDMSTLSPSDFKGINPEIIVHRLNVDSQVKPVKQKKRMFGVKRNKIIEEEVNKLLQAGFTREIQYTTWLSNVVIVPKAAGKWRMCTDFTDLNKACPKDPYPLPRIDLLVDSTAGCALFSMMDAYQGYHQIFMAKEDAEKTAFLIEKGVYCYNVMPFGLKNAGATYQRLVNRMFKDQIGSTMEVYVDDMLVKSKQESDHLTHLRTAFSIMRAYRMKLNPANSGFEVTNFWVTWSVMSKPDTSGRMVKCAVELGEFDIESQTRNAVKVQMFADFLGLQALDGGIRQLDMYTDSQLVAMQVHGTYEMREWSMTQYLAKVREMMEKFDKCTIHQIPRDKNARADALSKFGAMVEGIKKRKITVMVKSIPTIDEKTIHVMEAANSWKTHYIRYLKGGELPRDQIAARRLQFKANRFTMLGDEL